MRGFGLIEVMIALVVLAVGFAAIVKFQATVFGYSAGAKERALAARLADEKIADLRSYAMPIQTDGAGVAIACNVNIIVSYRCIANNAGGNKKEDFTLVLPSGAVPIISNVNYNRSWAVTDYYYPNTGVTPTYGVSATTTLPSPAPAYPPFKLATVTIAWTDQSNAAQSIAVSTIISAHDPAKSGKAIE